MTISPSIFGGGSVGAVEAGADADADDDADADADSDSGFLGAGFLSVGFLTRMMLFFLVVLGRVVTLELCLVVVKAAIVERSNGD